MTIGPAPMTRIDFMSVRFGMRQLVLALLLFHQRDEAGEEIVTVLRTRRSLGMVLHAEHRPILHLEPAIGTVEQRDVSLLDIRRQAVAVHGEAVIHRGDLDLAGGEVLHRVVRAVMALMHLARGAAEREAKHLMAETDAEQGQARVHELPDLRHGIDSGRRRIAWPVRQEHAVGLPREYILSGCRCRQHRELASGGGELTQDVALEPIIDGDDMKTGLGLPTITFVPTPLGLLPAVALAARHVLGEVEPNHAGQASDLTLARGKIASAVP